jgi:hypothetical protein
MDNKYNLPESWGEHYIADGEKYTTITLDKLQLRALLDQIRPTCVNELISPIWQATYKTISDAYWGKC